MSYRIYNFTGSYLDVSSCVFFGLVQLLDEICSDQVFRETDGVEYRAIQVEELSFYFLQNFLASQKINHKFVPYNLELVL